MKKLYFLALFSCLCSAVFAQTTVTIYADSTNPLAFVTGSSDGTTRFPGDIMTASNTEGGYAVFDLGRAGIPAGATIISVDAGFYVNAYIQTTIPNRDLAWNTGGFPGDLSTVAAPGALLTDILTAGNIYTSSYGSTAGANVVLPSTGAAVGFIQINVAATPGKVSLTYHTDLATTAQYDIMGETGSTASPTTPGHAPYLKITYCAVPKAVTAVATPNPTCEGSAFSLIGTATSATAYNWTGPNGFTSTDLSTTVVATPAAAGVYTLTVANVCGALINSVVATTATVTVTPGPITGITNVWVDFTTALGDPTTGGVWGSSSLAIATVGTSSGVVTGVSPGTVIITYATPSGCVFTTPVQVVQSVFSQLPTTAGVGGVFPLYAWYPFCADTLDKSSHGRDLHDDNPFTTPALLTTDRFGIANNAYSFNGVNNMLTYNPAFPITGLTNDFTYSCWFEADTAENAVILHDGTFNTDGWGFTINDGTIFGSGNQVGVMFGTGLFQSTPVTFNRWHNLMLKKNGGAYQFYVDNVSVGFFLGPPTPTVPTGVFQLGMDYTSTTAGGPPPRAFKGKIDDIAVYNRQLTTQEMDSLYNFNPDARVFTLGNDTTICADSITLFPRPRTLGNIYLWNNGATDSSITVEPAPGIGGNTYSLTIGKPYGCVTTASINVFTAPIPVNVGPALINLCAGDTITLKDTTLPSVGFLWSTGDTSHSIRVSAAGTYTVFADSTLHFTRDSAGITIADSAICVGHDTVTVNVYPVPTIGLDSFIAHCQGTHVTLIAHYDPTYTYMWGTTGLPNIGTGDSTIDSTLGLNTFWVTVTDVKCVRTDTVKVLIVFDTLTFSQLDVTLCNGEDTAISSIAVTVTNNFIANYQWTPTTGIGTSNVYDPIIAPDTSAEYILRVTYPGCPDIVDSFHIDVQPSESDIRVLLGNSRSVCQFDSLHILSTIEPSWYTHYNYTWTPTGFLDSSTTPLVIFRDTNNVDTINLVLSVTTGNNRCGSKDSVQIIVHQSKFLYDSLYNFALCPTDSVQLGDSILAGSGITATYSWTPTDYLSDPTAQFPWAYAVKSLDYRLIATSQYGCRDTARETVTVHPAATIYLGDSVTLYPGESYQISPQTNCVNFLWYPPLGLDNIYISNPIATPEVHTKYIVHASTEDGCVTSDSLVIRIDPGNYIALPNAFTPGASVNGTFFVFKRGIVSLNFFRIYDRWGNMVFQTNNIESGWDGTYNGKPQPFGVYTYEVEAVSVTGRIFDRVGNVTLIR